MPQVQVWVKVRVRFRIIWVRFMVSIKVRVKVKAGKGLELRPELESRLGDDYFIKLPSPRLHVAWFSQPSKLPSPQQDPEG